MHWENNSLNSTNVAELTGRFDSGTLENGNGFSVTIGEPGEYKYSSPQTPGNLGRIVIARDALEGADEDLVNSNIPSLAFPLRPQNDMAPHPTLQFIASRTRILLAFTGIGDG